MGKGGLARESRAGHGGVVTGPGCMGPERGPGDGSRTRVAGRRAEAEPRGRFLGLAQERQSGSSRLPVGRVLVFGARRKEPPGVGDLGGGGYPESEALGWRAVIRALEVWPRPLAEQRQGPGSWREVRLGVTTFGASQPSPAPDSSDSSAQPHPMRSPHLILQMDGRAVGGVRTPAPNAAAPSVGLGDGAGCS